MKIKIQHSELKSLIRECIEEIIDEGVTKTVDNFSQIANLINLTDPSDQFFYVQIIKRWKDNKDKGMVKDVGNKYHAGAEYGNVGEGTAFKVHTPQELLSLKQKIIAYCDANNARAYICCNPRSQSAIDTFKPQYLSRLRKFNHGVLPQYANYADDILSAQAKEDPSWTDRPRFFFDIDTKNKNVWATTKAILKQHNVPIEMEYETPSGGLHIVVADRFSIPNLQQVINQLRVFDNYRNMGRQQTVHANIDGKLILYSNVDTAGY